MWLPLTSRTRAGPSTRITVSATDPTQGPAALTSARAVTTSRLPLRIQDQPPDFAALGAHAFGAGADRGAALGGIERIQHDEARIVDPAIRIEKAELVGALRAELPNL